MTDYSVSNKSSAPDTFGAVAAGKGDVLLKVIKWLIYAVWFSLFLYLTICHEQFRDEAQSWMYAKYNSLWGLAANSWEEGHPWLWHLLLKPFTLIGFPYSWAKYIGFTLTAAGMAIYCHKSPFALPVTFATMFLEYSYYCSFARCYGLMFLVLVLTAASWKERKTRPFQTALCLGLMFSTHLIAWPAAYFLCIVFYGEIIRARRKGILPFLCTLIPVLLFCLPLYPQVRITLEKYGRSVIGVAAAGIAATALLTAAVVLFPKLTGRLRKDDADSVRSAALYSLPVAGTVFTYFLLNAATKSTIAAETNLLHLTEIVPAVICMFWCVTVMRDENPGADAADRSGRTEAACFAMAMVIMWVLVMQSQGLYKKILSDTDKYYSGGPATAAFINENLPEEAVIVATRRGTNTAVGAALKGGRKLIKLGSHEPLYYTEWCTDWPRFSENDCTRDLQTLIEKFGTVYVIYSDDTETAGLGKWLRRKITFMQGELVFKSDDYGSEKYGKDNYVPVEHVERFWLYKLTK